MSVTFSSFITTFRLDFRPDRRRRTLAARQARDPSQRMPRLDHEMIARLPDADDRELGDVGPEAMRRLRRLRRRRPGRPRRAARRPSRRRAMPADRRSRCASATARVAAHVRGPSPTSHIMPDPQLAVRELDLDAADPGRPVAAQRRERLVHVRVEQPAGEPGQLAAPRLRSRASSPRRRAYGSTLAPARRRPAAYTRRAVGRSQAVRQRVLVPRSQVRILAPQPSSTLP